MGAPSLRRTPDHCSSRRGRRAREGADSARGQPSSEQHNTFPASSTFPGVVVGMHARLRMLGRDEVGRSLPPATPRHARGSQPRAGAAAPLPQTSSRAKRPSRPKQHTFILLSLIRSLLGGRAAALPPVHAPPLARESTHASGVCRHVPVSELPLSLSVRPDDISKLMTQKEGAFQPHAGAAAALHRRCKGAHVAAAATQRERGRASTSKRHDSRHWGLIYLLLVGLTCCQLGGVERHFAALHALCTSCLCTNRKRARESAPRARQRALAGVAAAQSRPPTR